MPQSFLESDGRAVNVTLVATVPGMKEPVYAQGWLGLAESSGDSGEEIALTIDRREYQIKVPAALAVAKGDTIYVTLASAPANLIPDAAYSTSSGAGKKAFLKATSAKDVDNIVTGLILPEGV